MAAVATIPWGPLLILLPLAGGLLCFLWPKQARGFGIATSAALLVSVAGLGCAMLEGGTLYHAVGGWGAPLGIDLYADGLTLVMLIMTALVGAVIGVYATGYFFDAHPPGFWPLWLFVMAAMNALYLSADIFNLYVTLELTGLAAVSLTAMGKSRDAVSGAMRYLIATLLGSLLYLLGVGLLYHGYGSVDIAVLASRAESHPLLWTALALITSGLILKTALFPLHFWLPPAHASAPAPVSALLSALIVKASFYMLLRLWITVFGPLSDGSAETLFALLGGAAVLWGSLLALVQSRLKLLIAYSTVAQIGYLFLGLSLALGGSTPAWHAVIFLALSHAMAKSAMFLVAGNLLHFGGHDRISHLDRVAQRLPVTAAAFALAGVSIVGLPPSGGFLGKWYLVEAALSQGQWAVVATLLAGTLLAAAYIFKVVGHTFTAAPVPHEPRPLPARMEWTALALAGMALLTGLFAAPLFTLVEIGHPYAAGKAMP